MHVTGHTWAMAHINSRSEDSFGSPLFLCLWWALGIEHGLSGLMASMLFLIEPSHWLLFILMHYPHTVLFLRTFAPVWDVFKTSTEKLANCHLDLVRKLQELIKEVQKYGEEQVKSHKKVTFFLLKN